MNKTRKPLTRQEFGKVQLSPEEYKRAFEVAKLRNDGAIADGKKSRNTDEEDLAIHQYGCCSEIAACKALKLPWSESVGIYHNTGTYDIEELECEVRSIEKYHSNLLIKRSDRNLYQNFLLIYGSPSDLFNWEVIGYLDKEDVQDALQNHLITHEGLNNMGHRLIDRNILKDVRILVNKYYG